MFAAMQLTTRGAKKAIPIIGLTKSSLRKHTKNTRKSAAAWLKANGFTAAPRTFCLIPDSKGGIKEVLAGIDPNDPIFGYSFLPGALPSGTYRLAAELDQDTAENAALGWALGTYVFDRYKKNTKKFARLIWPENARTSRVKAAFEATALVRDLINTPTEDMGPDNLADAAAELAEEHDATVKLIVGNELLEQNYPTVHAVGRAADVEPRLIDISWGDSGPKVTLVGKGVCFDSGGLGIKSSAGMKLMKKDMGGAAHVLGVAKMVMANKLPVQLRVLVPAVENAISGNAFRPLDVITTRKGITVEVGHTDAEGRLILCDALAEAGQADLLVDFATLTGAARVALGTELPALFCNDDVVASELLGSGRDNHDRLWRMPLHQPYRRLLDSKVADINNISDGGYGGAITAALFLKEFVAKDTPWVHIDVMAWNTSSKPGRPTGGEAMGMRAVYGLIESKFGAEKAAEK